MRLTTKGRFAVTAMMDLAMRGDDGPVALASISERQQISLSYLEQLFGKLRRHRLVALVAATVSPAHLIRSRLLTSFVQLMNSLMLPSAGGVRTAMMSTAA